MFKKFEKQTEGAVEEKMEKYKEMLGDSKAVFMFSYGARETGPEGNKKMRPDSYTDLDIRGFMGGGHAITIAAAEIGQHFPDVKLVTTTFLEDKPSEGKPAVNLFEIYAQELKRLGIPEKQIELEKKSTTTISELIEMVKLARTRNWNTVAVLCDELHVTRVKEMVNKLEELAKRIYPDDNEFIEDWHYFQNLGGLDVHFLESEKILLERDPRYAKVIETVRKSTNYQKRKLAEEKGIQDIRNGTYGLTKTGK